MRWRRSLPDIDDEQAYAVADRILAAFPEAAPFNVRKVVGGAVSDLVPEKERVRGPIIIIGDSHQIRHYDVDDSVLKNLVKQLNEKQAERILDMIIEAILCIDISTPVPTYLIMQL